METEKEKEIMGNCPYCRLVFFRDGSIHLNGLTALPATMSFMTFCPHCRKKIYVETFLKIRTRKLAMV